jgi:hypothetical protein
MRYVRFVVAAPDPTSQVRQGVFQAAADLRDEGVLAEAEQLALERAIAWFSKHLKKPERFSRKRNAAHRDTRGIAWFKDTAGEPLRRIRELVAILEEHGRPVTMLTSLRPGYVVYEDEFQVVAEPFAETDV